MSSIFVSRSAAPKSKEQKKLSSLALRANTASRKRASSGPCVVIYKKVVAA